jgi:uncharacterized membrane protein
MGFLNWFGTIIIKFFSFLGAIILFIPKIPEKIRNVNSEEIRQKIDSDKIKNNISKITPKKTRQGTSEVVSTEQDKPQKVGTASEDSESEIIFISAHFTSEEKENTIFRLQILSAAFLVFTIIFLFNFLSIILYGIIGAAIIIYILYTLFNRVRVMYGPDFPAYRDFFLMYIAVGIILVLVGTNPNFVLAFSFQFLPSLTILIFAIISVVAVFLIFRIRYYRNYTYGKVIETGKNIAYVKVDYDIRSNVKPDTYTVDNSYGARDGDTVKLKIEEKLFSSGGNKPISIIETVKKI